MHRGVLDDVLGDLAEERALRSAHYGPLAAAGWWVRELSRSAPHVAGDAVRRALRSPADRAVVLGGSALVVTLIVAVGVSIASRDVPAQLSLGTADTVVVNNYRTSRIAVRLLDAAGRTLDDDARGARFRRMSATAGVVVSTDGNVTCARRGVARVLVERGALARTIVVQCAPVRAFFVDAAFQYLVVGGPAEPIGVRGVAPDSSPVTRMVGSVTVRDSNILAIDGSQLRPLRAGSTELQIRIGDETERLPVTVHHAAPSPSEVQIDEVFSKDLALAPGSEALASARGTVHRLAPTLREPGAVAAASDVAELQLRAERRPPTVLLRRASGSRAHRRRAATG